LMASEREKIFIICTIPSNTIKAVDIL